MSIEKILVNEAKCNIKAARELRGWTQSDLGAYLSRDRQWVNCIENEITGKNFRNLWLEDLIKISEGLKLPLAYFFRPNASKEKILWEAQELMKKLTEYLGEKGRKGG